MPVQHYHSVFAFEILATMLMKQTFIELQRPIITYPFPQLWYFNIQLVKLLSILATKHLFILLALSLVISAVVRGWGRSPPAYWQQQKVGIECTRTFISSSWRTKCLNSFSNPNRTQKPFPAASSSHLCFSRASQFSLHRFPCAIREHRRVKKPPVSTNDVWCLCLLSSSLTKVDAHETGAMILYVFMQSIEQQNKYTQVEHSSLCQLPKQGGVSRLYIPHESKPHECFVPFLQGVSTTELSGIIQRQTWISQAQVTVLAQTFNKMKWKVHLHHQKTSK